MKSVKLSILTSIGAGLEYYDFVIYGMLATYISHAFFPATDSIAALLQTFAVFALGYVIRPVGGILFGCIGDRYGRKKTFLITLLLMAGSTFAIGLLPDYQQWGLASTILLIILRLLQGLSFGAELPGAIIFISEHVSNTARGLYCGIILAGVSLGSKIGSLITYLLSSRLCDVQMQAWGWRIPFLAGALLAIVGYIIRRKTQETPLFLSSHKAQIKQWPIIELLKAHSKAILQGIGVTLFAACFIIFALGLPAYLHEFYGYPLSDTYLATVIGLAWAVIILPMLGWLSDKISRKRLLVSIAAGFVIMGYFLFEILEYKTFPALVLFIMLYQFVACGLAVSYFATLTELFPTPVRYTGVALCYNVVYSIAGFTPFIVSYLLYQWHSPQVVSVFFSLLAVTTVITALRLKGFYKS